MRYPNVKELSGHECWKHLRTMTVGRLALGGDGHPELFPVNYLVDHGTVLFRTDPGSKLAASLEKAKVAFEVDGYEQATNEAWSVVVKGGIGSVLEIPAVVEAVALPLFPWQFGPKAFFVRVVPELVSGRKFIIVDPAHWVSPLTGRRPSPME